ncbi:MAG TPA: RloB domain-containing protein [Anaerolineae bacterium]|nr:RloB domain-containing protein [Anaerolineae bacterium]
MPRRRRPFIRPDADRDARLIVIAAEDSKATIAYFQALVSPRWYQSSRVHVELLTRATTASAPRHVLQQLNQWREEYQIGADDELWLVIDVDRWGNAELSDVARECEQKNIRLAVSNPAIELWFLLHLTGLDRYTEEEKALLLENSRDGGRRTRLERAILEIAGQYNKSRLDAARYLPHVETAVDRARSLDTRPSDRWPQGLGTRVYLLAQSIIESASYRVGGA